MMITMLPNITYISYLMIAGVTLTPVIISNIIIINLLSYLTYNITYKNYNNTPSNLKILLTAVPFFLSVAPFIFPQVAEVYIHFICIPLGINMNLFLYSIIIAFSVIEIAANILNTLSSKNNTDSVLPYYNDVDNQRLKEFNLQGIQASELEQKEPIPEIRYGINDFNTYALDTQIVILLDKIYSLIDDYDKFESCDNDIQKGDGSFEVASVDEDIEKDADSSGFESCDDDIEKDDDSSGFESCDDDIKENKQSSKCSDVSIDSFDESFFRKQASSKPKNNPIYHELIEKTFNNISKLEKYLSKTSDSASDITNIKDITKMISDLKKLTDKLKNDTQNDTQNIEKKHYSVICDENSNPNIHHP
jgi:hypothetical protein